MTTHPLTLAHPRQTADNAQLYLLFLGAVLAGYALFGKGFAYLGVPPLFIGEATLGLGLLLMLTLRGWTRLFELPAALSIIPLVLWGLFCTIPHLGRYGVDALRDAVIFGYAGFAFILAAVVLDRPSRLRDMLAAYRRFWRFFLLAIPVIAVIFRLERPVLPTWPGSGVPILFVKEGDVMVHLAAILAFWVAGFEGPISWLWVIIVAACCATIGLVDRAGMLAFMVVAGLCLALRPRHTAAWRLMAMAFVAILMLWVTDIRFEIPGGKGRDISFRQLMVNVGSMFGHDSGEHGMDSNKDWRINWWTDVADYTFAGPHFWTGKGFGINLADDDGYQLFQDGSLRSPHSAHITFLARAGVPGLALWALVLATWAWGILAGYRDARRHERREWEALFLFLGMFFAALVVNASFDVYLEGPVGGVWFWCVYGSGMAAMWCYRNAPDALADDHTADGAQPCASS